MTTPKARFATLPAAMMRFAPELQRQHGLRRPCLMEEEQHQQRSSANEEQGDPGAG